MITTFWDSVYQHVGTGGTFSSMPFQTLFSDTAAVYFRWLLMTFGFLEDHSKERFWCGHFMTASVPLYTGNSKSAGIWKPPGRVSCQTMHANRKEVFHPKLRSSVFTVPGPVASLLTFTTGERSPCNTSLTSIGSSL